jgi:DNA-binding IscR family transcriptional regulator
MKVVNFLGQKGYLDTVRGRNGGIRLMREPRRIRSRASSFMSSYVRSRG